MRRDEPSQSLPSAVSPIPAARPSRDQDRGAGVPATTAAELREVAELSGLLTELAGLVRDLGALIIGLMAAAAGAGDRQARTFTIPPRLAELAAAHQELKAEQQALDARFTACASHEERTVLRGTLAALTERATRAVSAAAAAVTPGKARSPGGGPDAAPSPGQSGTSSR